ncbi:MAG: ABC transporter permease [Xanthomonadaceae bacterium]|nr:ABC transporter permease [Xanthomonadaceae bacterium]
MSETPRQPPTLDTADSGATLVAAGRWLLDALTPAFRKTLDGTKGGASALDASAVEALDTAGALALHRVAKRNAVEPHGLRSEFDALYRQVAELAEIAPAAPPAEHGFLHRVGEASHAFVIEAQLFLAFIGELSVTAVRAFAQPSRLRWKPMLHVFETAGWGALPILALLSFLIGIVVAYQAGVQLADYGANIFIADLIGIAVLREFGPLLAAIIVAGRTGSAFTAEIGTMKVTDEIDALRTIGVSPMEMLALPRVVALIIIMPLLTVFADIFGVFGGMVMAQTMLEVSFNDFIDRFLAAVDLSDYLTGIGKAPVFALLIASVGCHQGFQVGTSADSVGHQVTRSVVHSLFLIIVADAIFSVTFSMLGL